MITFVARLAAGETTYSSKLDQRSDDALRSRENVILQNMVAFLHH